MADTASGMRRDELMEFAYRSWPADARQLEAICIEVHRWMAPLTLSQDDEDDVVLAVSEAVCNCIEHAYAPAIADGAVELTFWTEPRSVCIEIVDHGAWREPSGTPTSCGRGIDIMRRLMAGVLIRHDCRGTRVFLSHLLPDDAVAPIVTAAAEGIGGASN